jgi:hypothetical protein
MTAHTLLRAFAKVCATIYLCIEEIV